MRLVEALVREIGIGARRVVFRADAAHEAGDDAALRQIVEHRELFRDVDRVVHQRQGAAEDRDLDRLGALDQRAGDQVGRRHQAVGGLVMLVDADRIEAELLGIDERVDVARVFLGALDRVVEAVRQHHPGRAVLRRLREIERPVRHQMEGDELHDATPSRNSRTWRATRAACSTCGRCPHSSTMTSRASGRRSRHSAAYGRRHDLVVVAPDDQRRQFDAVQPLLEIGIEPARLPAELRHGEAVPQHHVHLRLARRQRQDAVGEGLVVIEVAHRLLRPPDEIVAARHALDADAGRRELDEAAEARAVADQDLGGEPAAERVADQMDPVEPRLLDEVEIEHRKVRHRADPRRIVGAAEAGMLGHQQLVALGQRIEERQPLRHAARAVQEQHRGAAPGAVQPDCHVPDLELGELRRHLVRFLFKPHLGMPHYRSMSQTGIRVFPRYRRPFYRAHCARFA